jgi:hypothetical protein
VYYTNIPHLRQITKSKLLYSYACKFTSKIRWKIITYYCLIIFLFQFAKNIWLYYRRSRTAVAIKKMNYISEVLAKNLSSLYARCQRMAYFEKQFIDPIGQSWTVYLLACDIDKQQKFYSLPKQYNKIRVLSNKCFCGTLLGSHAVIDNEFLAVAFCSKRRILIVSFR